MSSYDEHLISQAGGDGDMLDQIQRRVDEATNLGEWETNRASDVVIYDPNGFGAYRLVAHADAREDAEFIAHARTDIPALLALVREQAAKLEAVRELADEWEMNAGPGSRSAEVFGPQKVSVEFAVLSIRAALEPTP